MRLTRKYTYNGYKVLKLLYSTLAQPTFSQLFMFSFRIKIRPRFLRDVSDRSMRCNIFDLSLDMPIGIAPTAMQKMAHPDGEIATAKGKTDRLHGRRIS